jgi:hypothetical protein
MPSQSSGDNLNKVRHETSRTFRRKEVISERKINGLETNIS